MRLANKVVVITGTATVRDGQPLFGSLPKAQPWWAVT